MRARGVTAAGGVLVALASCQSYEPRPLDLDAHRDAWHGRTLEESSLRSFLARVDDARGDQLAALDPADGLSLHEGRLVALAYNPELRLARLRAGKAAAAAAHAGLWADPVLSADVLRITRDVPDRWVISPGLTFTIPLSGRLAAEEELADAAQRAAELRAREAEWSVWHEVHREWAEWSAASVRVSETELFVDALDDLVRTTSRLAETGELPRTEAGLFSLEWSRRSIELRRLRGDVAVAGQALRARMGLAPDAPVTLVASLQTSPGGGGQPGVAARITEHNPTLARLRGEYDVAEEALRREVHKQYPDLSFGPQYESDEGQSRVGFLGALPLPLFNANRRGIAEARVERELARAAFETGYERLVGRRAMAVARAESSAAQRVDTEEVLIPRVDRQLADALQLTRLGESTSLVLFESLTRAHETKLALIDTRLAEALSCAELEYLAGPRVRSTDSHGTPGAPLETP